MRRIWLLLIVLPGLWSTTASADWFKVGASSTNSVWYVDPARISEANGKVQAWVRADGTADRSVKWAEAKELWSFDCSQHTMKVLSTVLYDSYGKLLSSSSVPDYEMSIGYEPVVPDTMGETVEKAVCSVLGK